MPNLFLLVDTFLVPRYTQPRTKGPYVTLALGQSMGHTFPPKDTALLPHSLCLHWSPNMPFVSSLWLMGFAGQAGGEKEAPMVKLSTQAMGSFIQRRARAWWAENAHRRQMSAPSRKILQQPLSPLRLLAEAAPFLHTNNEKRKTLNECAVKWIRN